MKKYFILCVVLVLCFSVLSVPAMAASEGISDPVTGSDTDGDTIVENPEDMGELVGVSTYALTPITSSSTTGLKAALLAVIGSYDPYIVEYEYQNTNGYISYLREIQLDYVWLCSAAILLVTIFCLFKLGGILCRR